MKYHQRDIVEVSFLFPDGTFKPHPIKERYFNEIIDKIVDSIF